MSEPLSREDSDFVKAVKAEAALIARLRARVAELEKASVDWERAWDGLDRNLEEQIQRADRAEAGLAAAQEALKEAMAYARDRKLECRQEAVQDKAPGSRYEFIGMANGFAEMSEHLYRSLDALARGGGQQDTG